MGIVRHIFRFIVSAIVLLFVSWIVPQFSIGGFFSALFFAVVIALIGWGVESLQGGRRITPFGRGIVGFIISAAVIWVSQFFVGNVDVTIIGALLAALVIGLLDLFFPISTPFRSAKSR
ncbi:phage holin family protein [Longirhabdus pacifica]|uniref:phage holin family protein n=1 Tax=Longirhabdus pacifica TaxID=2305227 RepID=UPI001008C017|nr:phage holin family protein [Longirhabdus pacifica]